MQIEIDNSITVQQPKHFKRGDSFPVLVNSYDQKRIFFSEYVSIIVGGMHTGLYVSGNRSVYDTRYTICVGESVTLTFTQD